MSIKRSPVSHWFDTIVHFEVIRKRDMQYYEGESWYQLVPGFMFALKDSRIQWIIFEHEHYWRIAHTSNFKFGHRYYIIEAASLKQLLKPTFGGIEDVIRWIVKQQEETPVTIHDQTKTYWWERISPQDGRRRISKLVRGYEGKIKLGKQVWTDNRGIKS